MPVGIAALALRSMPSASATAPQETGYLMGGRRVKKAPVDVLREVYERLHSRKKAKRKATRKNPSRGKARGGGHRKGASRHAD